MNYYDEIKNELINNEITKKIKDYSKNKSDLTTYYNVGKLLAEAGGHYGEGIIKEYSSKLQNEVGKKYSTRLLYKMRKYYNFMNTGKVPTVSAMLSWSHYEELLPYNDINKINYYIMISKKYNLSVRQLRERIKDKEYERLPEKTKIKLTTNVEKKIEDYIKNPIFINSPNNIDTVKEKVLKKLILDDMENFLEQLGEGFSFIKSEYKIKLGDRYNYIDLLLYNIKHKCYVVVELKATELKKEHTGQIMIYMNYIDENIKTIGENKTVGIIICKLDNRYVIKYCSDDRVIAREYKLVNEIL